MNQVGRNVFIRITSSSANATRAMSTKFPTRQASIVERKSHASDIFDKMDLKGTGQIGRDEWAHTMDNMPETELRSLARSSFDAIAEPPEDGSAPVVTKGDLQGVLGMYSSFQLDVLRRSLSRNELSYSDPNAEYYATEEPEEVSAAQGLLNRIHTTAEVCVSKIFPAGFGWQGMSVVADGAGYAATDTGFFLMTGLGDATGVFCGHVAFYAIKKAVWDQTISMKDTVHTGALLAVAAFHAGTAWQPIVNFLHDTAHLDFNGTLAGTFLGCGGMFYVGLRVGRGLLSPMLSGVAPASYANLKADAGLSVSIGGATGCFVGTDVSFVTGEGAAAVDTNWLRGVVGIEDGTSDVTGMMTAGCSTALGFGGVQMVQNAVVTKDKCWCD